MTSAPLTVFTARLGISGVVPVRGPTSPLRGTARALCLAVLMTLASSPTVAQGDDASTATTQAQGTIQTGVVSVGVITSRSGSGQATGASQALAASAWAAELESRGGVYGVRVDVDVVDDGGVPARAAQLALELSRGGAHAIVCCTTPAASRAVAQVAEETGVLLLSPTELTALGTAQQATYWAFALWPDDTDSLSATVAAVLSRGRGSAALMTLANEFGERASTVLAGLLGYAGMHLAAEVAYQPGTMELRPEALLLASHLPGAVVVWGLADDLGVAYRALRARGYEGPVFGRTALVSPGAGVTGLGTLAGVRFAVPPALAPAAMPAGYQCSAAVEDVERRLAASYGGIVDLAAAAPVVDALDLLAAGVEQLLAMQLPPVPIATERQALRDALVGLPERCGAGGLLDLQEGRTSAVVPRGLIDVTVGRFGTLEADER